MQVPFESLKRAAKEKKASLDEVSSIAKMLDIQTAAATTAAEQLEILSKMAVRLQNLKRKVAIIFKQYRTFWSWHTTDTDYHLLQLEESSQEEHADAVRCQARLQHLQKLGGPAKDEVIDWNRKRLDRLLVDHLLHSGHYKSAEALSSESHIEVQISNNPHASNNDLACTLRAKSAKPDQLAWHCLAMCRSWWTCMFLLEREKWLQISDNMTAQLHWCGVTSTKDD